MTDGCGRGLDTLQMTPAESLAMTRDVPSCDVTKSHPVSVVLISSRMSESKWNGRNGSTQIEIPPLILRLIWHAAAF